jgi:methionyl-tRNA formyltransferase
MQMDAGLDTGPVHIAHSTPIGPQETAGELHDRLATLAAETLLGVLPAILGERSAAVPQRAELATVAPKISKSEAVLDWSASATELERRVRAFNPWPIAEAQLRDGRRLRIWEAAVLEGAASRAPPGSIVAVGKEGIDVATGAGVLRVRRIQPPSGRVMDVDAYLAAHPLAGAAFVG